MRSLTAIVLVVIVGGIVLLSGTQSSTAQVQSTPTPQPPTAPVLSPLVAGDGQITASWTVDNTGSAITDYTVTYAPCGTTDDLQRDNFIAATTHTITGLTNGQCYWVVVGAYSAACDCWSDYSNREEATPVLPPTAATATAQAVTPPSPSPTLLFMFGNSLVTVTERVGTPGQSTLRYQRHDRPEASFELGVGWISQDGSQQALMGFVRDESLGQTYAIVRRESDGQIVRWWIAADSPWVYLVPWDEVIAQYTVPVQIVAAVPLDEQYPWPNQLVRRFDGEDVRILAYDADLAQWRHVPDVATFQALGFYWCDVTVADAGFFERIAMGPPYPASTMPARHDYPGCRG